jgi:hypothetical protein
VYTVVYWTLRGWVQVVIQGGSFRVWVGGVMYVILRMFAFFGLS